MTKKTRVADLLQQGLTVADAARKAGCSKSWAYAIKAELASLRLGEIHAMMTETLHLTGGSRAAHRAKGHTYTHRCRADEGIPQRL